PRRPDSFDPRALLTLADRNSDGKLDSQEVETALRVLTPLLTGCRVTVLVSDQGTGLFELLDRNADSRLSPRELADAANVLKPFADSSGRIAPEALPRRLVVTVGDAPIPVVQVPQSNPAVRSKPTRPEGLAWFTAMDRNGDGDVSLREFIGPIELFRKL